MNKINVEVKTKEQRDELIKQLQEMEFKKELPKSWEDIGLVCGFWIHSDSEVKIVNLYDRYATKQKNRNIFKTEKQALKSLAMSKLSQAMAVYNDGWEADWSDYDQSKYCVFRDSDEIKVYKYRVIYKFLAFKSKDLALLFLENFREDIEAFFEL